jgi:hypothetical protein
MSEMDIHFWDQLIAGLDSSDLDWLKIRIERRQASLRPEIIVRKTIIRKED